MTKPNYTPGPWTADCMNNVWGQATGRHGKIANLADRPQDERYDVIPKDEVEANAHLIAAAPDMYEALCQVLQYASIKEKAFSIIQRAIAKAEGRE